jgi:serine/threonine-protein kinase
MDPRTQRLTSASGAPLPPGGPEPDLTGKTLGDFRVLRRLGQGGMGQIYLAEQISLKRNVALKILRAELAASHTSLVRFKKEAEAVARVTHANIVQVYAIGECEGLHYMALEYVEGRNLREYLEKKGPPEVLVALSIMRLVAAALQRAGELAIIHRDIKPENILLTRKGEAKVTDFGLARCFVENQPTLHLTASGVTMGTPLYMSPEQAEGKPVDPRTDIYSFGVTCYHMLAGHPPFQGVNPFEVALQHVQAEPRPLAEVRPDLPRAMCAIVHKMMAKSPAARYQAGREIVRDLARLRDTLVGVTSPSFAGDLFTGPVVRPTQPIPVARPAAAPRPKRWLKWAAAGSVLLALLAGGLVGWLSHPGEVSPPQPGNDRSTPADAAADAGDVFVPFPPTQQERERALRAEWKKYGKAGEDRPQMTAGLNCAIDLGLFYLDAWRLDDADRFFGELRGAAKPEPYQTLGRLGHAMVLAFRDRPRESNELIKEIIGHLAPRFFRPGARGRRGDERAWYFALLRSNRLFRRTLARALEHNFENDPRNFPQPLQGLRLPPGQWPRPRPRDPRDEK